LPLVPQVGAVLEVLYHFCLLETFQPQKLFPEPSDVMSPSAS
jgi:hypothetical protein